MSSTPHADDTQMESTCGSSRSFKMRSTLDEQLKSDPSFSIISTMIIKFVSINSSIS